MLKENVWIYVQHFGKTFCDWNLHIRKDEWIELHTCPGVVGHTCNLSHLGGLPGYIVWGQSVKLRLSQSTISFGLGCSIVEHLLIRNIALALMPSTTKRGRVLFLFLLSISMKWNVWTVDTIFIIKVLPSYKIILALLTKPILGPENWKCLLCFFCTIIVS